MKLRSNMRKAIVILAALLACPMLSYAQLGNLTLKHFPGVPTGSCSRNQVAEDDANGAFYSCLNGSWNAVGGGSGISLQTNGTNNASQTALNFVTSTTNAVGLTATPANSTSTEKFEITGAYSGSLASATGLPWTGLSGITSGNIIGLWTGTCSSSTYLNGAGACGTPAGSGTVTDGTGSTTANKTAVSTTTAHQINYIDFPQALDIPAANCNNTTAGAGWSIGSGGTATCRAGTNNKGGFISITDTAATFATFQIAIPEDWDAAANPYIRFQLASTDATSGHTIIPSIQVACYKGDGSTTDDVAANAAHSLSTVTLNTTANQFWSTSNVQLNSTDMTGCVAGAIMQITVGRATDTATNAEFYSATVTFPRLLAVQAN